MKPFDSGAQEVGTGEGRVEGAVVDQLEGER